MKTIWIALALVFSLTSTLAVACPKGTHPVGGTGTHHKGGKCVGADAMPDAKAPAATAETKPEDKAVDTAADTKKAKKKAKAK